MSSSIADFGSLSSYLDFTTLAAGDVTLDIVSVFIRGVTMFLYLMLITRMCFVVAKKRNNVTLNGLGHVLVLFLLAFLNNLTNVAPDLDCDKIGTAYGVFIAVGLSLKHVVFLLRALTVLNLNEGFPRVAKIGVFLIGLFMCVTVAGYSQMSTYKNVFGTCGFAYIHPLVNFSASLNIINDAYFLALFLLPLYKHILISKFDSSSLAHIFEEGMSSVLISSIVSLIVIVTVNLAFQPELFILLQACDLAISSMCVVLLFTRRVKTYSSEKRKYVVTEFNISRRAKKKQVWLLSLMATAIIGSQATIFAMLKNNDSTRVNIAGRQRMLSQRLVLECYESVYFSEKANTTTAVTNLETEIASTLDLWQSSELALVYGDSYVGLSAPETDKATLTMYKTLQPLQQKMLLVVNNFLYSLQTAATPVSYNDTSVKAALVSISSGRLPYLNQMNNIVTVLQNRSSTDSSVTQVLIIEYILIGLAVTAGLLQCSIIMRKSYGRVKDHSANNSRATGEQPISKQGTGSRHGTNSKDYGAANKSETASSRSPTRGRKTQQTGSTNAV